MSISVRCLAIALALVGPLAVSATSPVKTLGVRTGPDWLGVEEKIEASFVCSDLPSMDPGARAGRYSFVRGSYRTLEKIEDGSRLLELSFGERRASQTLLDRVAQEWQVEGFAHIESIAPRCSVDGRDVRFNITYWRGALQTADDNGRRSVVVILDHEGGEWVNGEVVANR